MAKYDNRDKTFDSKFERSESFKLFCFNESKTHIFGPR